MVNIISYIYLSYAYPSVECLFMYFSHFTLDYYIFVVDFKGPLYILETSLVSDMLFENIFSQFVALPFIHLAGFFTE